MEDINKILKSLNLNNATGPDCIRLEIIKTAANVIDSHLVYIINKDLKDKKFSENAKIALVRPITRKMIETKSKLKTSQSFKWFFQHL